MTDSDQQKRGPGRPPSENSKKASIRLRVHQDIREKFFKLGGTPWFEKQVESAVADEVDQ